MADFFWSLGIVATQTFRKKNEQSKFAYEKDVNPFKKERHVF